jgi:hypothetical protein
MKDIVFCTGDVFIENKYDDKEKDINQQVV